MAPGQKDIIILIVEDDNNSRQVFLNLLSQVGFTVIEAVNGQEAVDLFQRHNPDMIWMDMRLPIMDGLEATKKIRQTELKRTESSTYRVLEKIALW